MIREFLAAILSDLYSSVGSLCLLDESNRLRILPVTFANIT